MGGGAIPLLHPIASSSQTLASGTVDPIHLEVRRLVAST